ncbi:cell division protein ZapA [Pseudomonas stutzeri]|nr:cell division protein ZapA [Stutzerimonas stutzeri]
MNQTQTVTVQILDKEYPIACPPQQRANLESAARYVDGKMREIRNSGKVIGADRIAVLAALNIAHELLQRGAAPAQPTAGDTRERMRELLDRVDRALQERPPEQRQG